MMRRLRIIWITLLIAVGSASFTGSQLTSMGIISLPLLTISVTTFLYLFLYITKEFTELGAKNLHSPKVLDAGIFILLILSVLLGRISRGGVNDWYYIVVIGTTTLLCFRIVSPPLRVSLNLLQIIILAVIVRATPWVSYPIYGQDRFHQTAAHHIILTGDIVPESVTYYANFPAAHVFVAAYTNVTGLEFKLGYFSLGIVVSISLIAVYLLSRSLLQDNQSSLVAALFVAVAGYHVKAGAEPFAQALFTGLVPFIFYLLLRDDRTARELFMLVLITLFAVTIQNIAPLLLLGLCGVVIATDRGLQKISTIPRLSDFKPQINIPLSIVSLIGIAGVYHYVIADYLRFQTMRVVWLSQSLFGDRGVSEKESLTDSSATGTPTIELFGMELPDLLFWAAPILTVAGILLIVFYILVQKILEKETELGPIHYIITVSIVFMIFAIVFAAGSPAIRALPSVMVLIAPVIGWILLQLTDAQPKIGQFLVLFLIFCTVTAGVLTPPVAKAELSDDDFRAWMDTEEAASVEFAMSHADEVQSSTYFAGYESYLLGSNGSQDEVRTLTGRLNKENPDSVEEYNLMAQNGETILYTPYYQMAYGVNRPQTNKIYSSGDVALYT